MSEMKPKGVYVYQPHPVSRKDGRLWQVGGLPTGMTRDEAQAVADAINEICWLTDRCAACGHRFRLASDSCPQCGMRACAPWDVPKRIVQRCACERCVALAGKEP